ncbi:Inorganic phosphate transporter pho84 [Pseudogymnoascus verrucosus]|uniref:Inorganic phosphate transporter pho84 n=1 Tax=Pseudogymnoascus verrucosus TaxID=342668 RepID=A0A1B8GEE4_9PEZI|nr:Inorganic phosphate transporter pho84 [Pseudogymnoascus verrucosus]OBT94200.1 Inorganic phosphate transporter pho84 [Pseudogymnoascus verrucosus]
MSAHLETAPLATKARTSWLQNIKFFALAGTGFFSDGYLNITMGLVVPMIGLIYFKDSGSVVKSSQSDAMKGSLSLGMVFGQVGSGILGDAIGRHKIYGKELILTIFGTLMVIVAPPYMTHEGIVVWVCIWRAFTGIGIGADYPMSATLSSENKPVKSRAVLVSGVFSNYGLGSFSASIVYLVLIVAFKSAIENNIDRVQWVWRLLLGIGIIPAAATLYGRLRMKETVPYQKYVETRDGRGETIRKDLYNQWVDFKEYFSVPLHARTLFATCCTWFLFDIAFYGINLNQSLILSSIGYGAGKTHWQTLYNTAIGNIIVAAAGFLPGYYAAIPLLDILGRVRQQWIGCCLVATLYAIWAGVANITSAGGLIALFTLSQFFLNAGPATTTFLIPVEVFPTRVRATAHGISAAVGKCGAILTTFAFGTITAKIGLRGVLGLFSGILFLTALLTLWIPESKDKTLEQIENGDIYGGNEWVGWSTKDAKAITALETSETSTATNSFCSADNKRPVVKRKDVQIEDKR